VTSELQFRLVWLRASIVQHMQGSATKGGGGGALDGTGRPPPHRWRYPKPETL